jgi:serine/threonine protein kinase/tetratricopeptide (TPR) repeat protein
MIGTTVAHYRVLDEIGAGGMGVVYRAQDLRLGRHVALKCLPPELSADPVALARLRREAETVSSLSHPHICTLFDLIEQDGRQYLVLELVEGRSLADEIRHQPMPVDRALTMALQLADALDAAHTRGIVHRDVKPANVIVSARGDAKLLDFGVAALTTPAGGLDHQDTRTRLTMRGGVVGTLEYMAPEQIRGEAVDERADLFALGAVVHEMLTGHPAFRGASNHDVIDAVLHHTPPAPSLIAPAVPQAFDRVVQKALEKQPDLRYQSARDLLVDLRRLARGTDLSQTAPAATNRRRPWVPVAIVLPVVVAGGLWAWRTRDATRIANGDPSMSPATESARLVVLPFENLTRKTEDDWLAGAFADSVSAGLQPVARVILVPRERVLEVYAADSRREAEPLDTNRAQQLSSRLRVRYYVHGSYQKVGDELRVVARLVDVVEDEIRVQETLTGRFDRIFQLEETLAQRLAAQLAPAAAAPALSPVPSTAKGTSTDATDSLVAYQKVTEARGLYALGLYPDAQALLLEATRLDPKYTGALALLSKTESRSVSPAVAADRPSRELLQRALARAQAAIALDPALADGHVAAALAYRGMWDRQRMREAATRAIALDGGIGEPRVLLGDALSVSPGFGCPVDGDAQAAESAYLGALQVDPLFASGYMNLTTNRWWMGRRVEALESIDAALIVQPQNVLLHSTRPFNLLFAGRVDEADGVMAQRVAAAQSLSALESVTLGYLALARRRFDEADRIFARADVVRSMGNLALRLITATAFFEAGRPAEGARHLREGIGVDPNCARWAQQVPALAAYRQTPEFTAVVR